MLKFRLRAVFLARVQERPPYLLSIEMRNKAQSHVVRSVLYLGVKNPFDMEKCV